jgi:hypothetical protein
VVDRVALSRSFSEDGGRQFMFDVKYGWQEAAREAGIRRPETGTRRLLNMGALLALPAGAAAASQQQQGNGQDVEIRQTTNFSTVMRLAWDESAEGTRQLAEVLERVGVEGMTRDEVKRVLRRRPECWR